MMKKLTKYNSNTKTLKRESSGMKRTKPNNKNLVKEEEDKINNLIEFY
jgi:hypothetical protein